MWLAPCSARWCAQVKSCLDWSSQRRPSVIGSGLIEDLFFCCDRPSERSPEHALVLGWRPCDEVQVDACIEQPVAPCKPLWHRFGRVEDEEYVEIGRKVPTPARVRAEHADPPNLRHAAELGDHAAQTILQTRGIAGPPFP